MIELKQDKLVVSFPDLPFPDFPYTPRLEIDFQRTLRIPDDGRDYPLPPGLGSFPLRHIDDYAHRVPAKWLDYGGVLLPMWQSEALWLRFYGELYLFAVKVATGKISAITGEMWEPGLCRNPQNYLVLPCQRWLDGYCVEKGIIRQFIAMPLGQGYSAEEQLTGEAEFGGLQFEVFPMRPAAFHAMFPPNVLYNVHPLTELSNMGLAPGGRMRQEIVADPFSMDVWDTEHSTRCFVHLVNSTAWQAITGQRPPSTPVTAQEYTSAGFPWFDYYAADTQALGGSGILARLKSVMETAVGKRAIPLKDNESVTVSNVVNLRAGLKPHQVRESERWSKP